MLIEKKTIERDVLEMMCTELLAPQEHLLRKIDAAGDFNKIYELVGDLYCKDNGRPNIDPIVLFKIVLIQRLYTVRRPLVTGTIMYWALMCIRGMSTTALDSLLCMKR